MATVFTLLDSVRRRPSMYVGLDPYHRLGQLRNLELLLHGYAHALSAYDLHEEVENFCAAFMQYLHETRGWETACGPTAAIRDAVENDDQAWEMFWSLVDEFREAVARGRRG
jgi:hypothetical protein